MMLQKAGKLPPEKEELFRILGVVFEIRKKQAINDEQWQNNYMLLKEFIEVFGRQPWNKDTYKGANIGAWVRRQMVFQKAGKLSPERERLLRAVGVEFDKSRQDVLEEQWQNNYMLLKGFVEVFGCPPRARETHKGVKLGSWFADQVKAKKVGKLLPERERLLREIGVNFEPKALQQDGCLSKLVDEAEKSKCSDGTDGSNCDKSKRDCPVEPGDR